MPKALRDSWLLAGLERERVLAPAALEALRQEGPEWVASAVVAKDLAPADVVRSLAAKAAHVSVADFAAAEPSAVQFVPEAVARQYLALPLAASNRVITIATANPLDLDAEQALGFVAGRQVEFRYALPQTLLQRLDEVYGPERSIERLVGGLEAQATVQPTGEGKGPAAGAAEAPAARLVEALIADAVHERASDVHCEPDEQGLVIRYRVDGVLREVTRIPRNAAGSVIRRLKVLARLDIADPLRAHEGRATARVEGKPWDLVVSSAPVARYGEQVAVRLLDPAATPPTLSALGLWPDEQQPLESLLGRREGILLWVGPPGTGKLAALHASLQHVLGANVEAATVEDPVAYHLSGVRQFQVDEKAGAGFGALVRAALKDEPAVMLVGSIRDGETAAALWQATSSGHLILSSVRAADLAGALGRLQTLGIPPAKVAEAVRGFVVQRLVRQLCPRCAEPGDGERLPQAVRPPAAFERPVCIRKAKGCSECGFSGYRGRLALQELLVVDGPTAELISSGAPEDALILSGRRHGLRTLFEAGMRRVWAGETTYEELVRVVGEPAPAPAKAAPAPAAAPAAPLALVADDDPAMRALIAAMLKAESFDVAEAADGLEALDRAQRLSPAILILDMEMPRLDGFGVLEALHRRLAGHAVPVIVVTAHDEPATEVRAIEMGAEDFLTKPIQPSSLIVRIRAVLRRVGGQGAWPKS